MLCLNMKILCYMIIIFFILKKMVFNICNKWKFNEKKGVFSVVIVSFGIKMENV